MKRGLFIGLIVVGGVIAGFIGCEVQPAGNDGSLKITPQSIGLYPDQTQDFTASGGYEYTWSLQDGAGGILSSTSGDTVRYTSRPADSNATSSDTLTVVSTIPGNAGGSSNSTESVVSTTALIEHLAVTATTTNGELQLSPTSATMSLYDSASFTATGGDGTYTWYLAQSSEGRLTSTDSSQTTYTLTTDPGPGVTNLQVIYVTSDGQSASANIVQATAYNSTSTSTN